LPAADATIVCHWLPLRLTPLPLAAWRHYCYRYDISRHIDIFTLSSWSILLTLLRCQNSLPKLFIFTPLRPHYWHYCNALPYHYHNTTLPFRQPAGIRQPCRHTPCQRQLLPLV
jgi:hypothetical protein